MKRHRLGKLGKHQHSDNNNNNNFAYCFLVRLINVGLIMQMKANLFSAPTIMREESYQSHKTCTHL